MSTPFAVFIITLLFFGLDFWDRSQGGKGFVGVIKILRRILKGLIFLFGSMTLLMFLSLFSASEFWRGVFWMLVLPGTSMVCTGFSIMFLFFFVYVYASGRR